MRVVNYEKTPEEVYTVKIDGVYLHSKYKPLSEAERFINTQISQEYASVCLLIEPGLGYLHNAVKKRFPYAKIISIHAYEFNREYASNCDCTHIYSGSEGLENFLYKVLKEEDVEGLCVIEWPVSKTIFTKELLEINEAISSWILASKASLATIGSRGTLFLKNAIRNMLHTKNIVNNIEVKGSILVAASGPSLEKSINFIKENRSSFFIIALSSAYECLRAHSIQSDLICTQDPGFWARSLLQIKETIPICATISSQIPTEQLEKQAFLWLTSANQVEQEIVKNTELPPLDLGSDGTVSFLALKLAAHISNGNIYIAGLDFMHEDIMAHAKGHAFNSLYFYSDTRFKSAYSAMYIKSLEENTTKAQEGKSANKQLSYYASWLNNNSRLKNIKAYRLFPTSVRTPSFIDLVNTKEIELEKHIVKNVSRKQISKTISMHNFMQEEIRQILIWKETCLRIQKAQELPYAPEIILMTAYPDYLYARKLSRQGRISELSERILTCVNIAEKTLNKYCRTEQ